MPTSRFGSVLPVLLCCSVLLPGVAAAQTPQRAAAANAQPQKYKLTIIEGASSSKRVKKGRVSSQAVVKITDENDVPVPGIAVTFALPQFSAGGVAFANGGLLSVVTTNTAGIASSGSFAAASGTSFSVSVSASVPSGLITGAVPVSTGAAAAGSAGTAGAAGAGGGGAGGGASTGLIVGIVAGAGAVAAVAAKVLTGGKPPAPSGPTVGSPSSVALGAPR